ncbi:MAG: uroporphyrinogen-III synthase [Vulcanimicrobiota bacterium]
MDRVAADLKLPHDHSVVFLRKAPSRWDEYLDLDLPILISHTCAPWSALAEELWQAGLSGSRPLRLVESSGAVLEVSWQEQSLIPTPSTTEWSLALNWTHPEEGWRSRLPLWGKHYLVTRQREQGQGLVERLESLGARVTATPTIEFVEPDDPAPILQAIESLEQFQWILFTSPNGVRYFFARLQASSKDHRALAGAKLACIGPGTARALAEQGFKADLLPESFVAEGLLETLAPIEVQGLRILLPRAQEARAVLPETLRSRGAQVLVAAVYKTVHPQLPEEVRTAPGATALFTSSSTVRNWVELTGDRETPCHCIGPITAETARQCGLKVLGVAPVHTIDGLVDSLLGP